MVAASGILQCQHGSLRAGKERERGAEGERERVPDRARERESGRERERETQRDTEAVGEERRALFVDVFQLLHNVHLFILYKISAEASSGCVLAPYWSASICQPYSTSDYSSCDFITYFP